jgi:G3E family GTPase
MEGRDLDAIVVELSGVADPAAVRQNWDQAVRVRKRSIALLVDDVC